MTEPINPIDNHTRKLEKHTFRICGAAEAQALLERCGGTLPDWWPENQPDDGTRQISAVVECGTEDLTAEFQEMVILGQAATNGGSADDVAELKELLVKSRAAIAESSSTR